MPLSLRRDRASAIMVYLFFVMRGLDPRIHLSCETDGLPGQARQ
jgi:hypothetical protein